MRPVFQIGNLFLYAGIVTSDVRFGNRANENYAVLTLRDRTDEILPVLFRDNVAKQIVDRIRMANILKGSYISILAKKAQNTNDVIGLDFKFSGLWVFRDPNGGKDTTVLHGTACSPREPKDGIFSVTVPIKGIDGFPIWYEVTFYNSYNGSLTADIAKQLLKPKTACCIRGGEVRKKVASNGKTYNKITGFGVDIKPY